MPAATAASKSTIQLQLVGHEQVAAVGMDGRVGIRGRVGARVGPDVKRQRDQAADGLQYRLPPRVADDHEPLGELAHLRRL